MVLGATAKAMASGVLWRSASMSRELSEMMQVQQRSEELSMRDAEWQAHFMQAGAAKATGKRHFRHDAASESNAPAQNACDASAAQQKTTAPSPTAEPTGDVSVSGGLEADFSGAAPSDVPTETRGNPPADHIPQAVFEGLDEKDPLHGSDSRTPPANHNTQSGFEKAKSGDDTSQPAAFVRIETFADEACAPDPAHAGGTLDTEPPRDVGSASDADLTTDCEKTGETAEPRRKKIRRKRMTKEEEARFTPDQLKDLSGTTAAKSRKMTPKERDIMLHKRRLRNRESAARSRDKQRKTIGELSEEMDALSATVQRLTERAKEADACTTTLRNQNSSLLAQVASMKAELESIRKENATLRISASSSAPSAPLSRPLTRPSSTLHLSFSSSMLDKVFLGGQQAPQLGNGVQGSSSALFSTQGQGQGHAGVPTQGTANQSLIRVPSLLRVNFSTDKLDGLLPSPIPMSNSFSAMLESAVLNTSTSQAEVPYSAAPVSAFSSHLQAGNSRVYPVLTPQAGPDPL